MIRSKNFFLVLIFIVVTGIIEANETNQRMYFCTAADTEFYQQLVQWIGAIHRHDFDSVVEIAVYDLGLTQREKTHLATIEKVTVNSLEMTHPHLLKKFHVRASNSKEKDRTARGWYAWKPVVIKQALDKFPYVLYLDCGVIPQGSMKNIFKCIQEQGYFLMSCGHSINWMTTEYVIQQLNLRDPENNFILEESTKGISAGLQGFTHAVYDSYVLPMYELTKNIRMFADDGTTPDGFGTARHDQALFSIFAHKNRLKIFGKEELLEQRRVQGYFHFKRKMATEQFIKYKK